MRIVVNVAAFLLFAISLQADFIGLASIPGNGFQATFIVENENTLSYQILSGTTQTNFGLGGLSRNPSSGDFYSIGYGSANPIPFLYDVNPFTGQIRGLEALSSSFTVGGLAYSPLDGFLYASALASDALYRIDPATGSVSVIAHLGTGYEHGFSLAFGPDNQLYGYTINNPETPSYAGYFRVDPASGAVTRLTSGSFSPVVQQIAFAPNGSLYGVYAGSLYQFDPATGQEIALLGTAHGTQFLAFLPNPVIPEPASLLLAGLGLVTTVIMARRRSRACRRERKRRNRAW